MNKKYLEGAVGHCEFTYWKYLWTHFDIQYITSYTSEMTDGCLWVLVSQNHRIFWVPRGPQGSPSPALKWTAHTGLESTALALLAPGSDWLSYICICVNIVIFKDKAAYQLNSKFSLFSSFICVFLHSLYDRDITLSIWCIYFPEVPFLLLFSEHIPLQVVLLFIDGMSCIKETQPSLS